MILPATREIALRAARLNRRGIMGKALANKLRLANAVEANRLASHGFLIERDERSKLTHVELLCIRLIDIADQAGTAANVTSSIKGKRIDWMARRSRGWCGRTIDRRLRGRREDEERDETPLFGLAWHSRNGYVGLTAAGRALAHALRDVPPHILAKWGLRQ